MSNHANAGAGNPVVQRKKIDEAVVTLTVPVRGNVERRNLPEGQITFYSFGYSVRGGSVSAHLRTEEPDQHKGRKIRARAEVWKKRRENGDCEIFIDLYPVEERPTYRMCVTEAEAIPPRYCRGPVRTHQVPKPKQGLVIFAAIG